MNPKPSSLNANSSRLLSPGEITGLVLLLISITLSLFFNFMLTLIPLGIFLALCWTAPFLTGFSFFLDVGSRGKTGKPAVALTFDDGPDPSTTPALLRLLSKHKVKAAFFVIGKKAEKNPDLIRDIVFNGHMVGNHSFSHDPFLMLKRKKNLVREIKSAQDVLKKLGLVSFAFRPPAGITNPLLGKVLGELGMYNVNFSCRAFDAGNRRVECLAAKILKKAGPDDIILLHDKNPGGRDFLDHWLGEVEDIIMGLKKKGLAILPLNEIIEKSVMEMEEDIAKP